MWSTLNRCYQLLSLNISTTATYLGAFYFPMVTGVSIFQFRILY